MNNKEESNEATTGIPLPHHKHNTAEFTDTGGPAARCQRKSQLSLSDKILIGVKSHKRLTTAERFAAWQLSVLQLATTQIPPLYRIGCPAAWLAILLARSHCWITILLARVHYYTVSLLSLPSLLLHRHTLTDY